MKGEVSPAVDTPPLSFRIVEISRGLDRKAPSASGTAHKLILTWLDGCIRSRRMEMVDLLSAVSILRVRPRYSAGLRGMISTGISSAREYTTRSVLSRIEDRNRVHAFSHDDISSHYQHSQGSGMRECLLSISLYYLLPGRKVIADDDCRSAWTRDTGLLMQRMAPGGFLSERGRVDRWERRR